MNKNGVPVTLVISQLVITSIALIILTNTGGGNNMSFLIALALTVVIYLCAYFMLFIGYIVLVLKHPDLKRTFNIPGGKGEAGRGYCRSADFNYGVYCFLPAAG